MTPNQSHLVTIAIWVLSAFIIGLLTLTFSQEREINKIQKNLCAFVFEEDGSASIRTDDFDRFNCMNDSKK